MATHAPDQMITDDRQTGCDRFHFLTLPATPVVEIIPMHDTNADTIERLFSIARARPCVGPER